MKGRLALAENQMDKAVDTLDMVSELFFLYVCAYLSTCIHVCACMLCDLGVGIISHQFRNIV